MLKTCNWTLLIDFFCLCAISFFPSVPYQQQGQKALEIVLHITAKPSSNPSQKAPPLLIFIITDIFSPPARHRHSCVGFGHGFSGTERPRSFTVTTRDHSQTSRRLLIMHLNAFWSILKKKKKHGLEFKNVYVPFGCETICCRRGAVVFSVCLLCVTLSHWIPW